jgi:hypothetical protein
MQIRDPNWLMQALRLHGRVGGNKITCFGSSFSPEDFIYFTVHPDRLSIELHRILPGVASLYFRFLLHVEQGDVIIQRVLDDVQGIDKKIRKELGEPYVKASVGMAFTNLTSNEEEWVEIALNELQKWPA